MTKSVSYVVSAPISLFAFERGGYTWIGGHLLTAVRPERLPGGRLEYWRLIDIGTGKNRKKTWLELQ